MRGGRGGGKSYAAARALLLQGVYGKHRILCTREIQRSIKDSVHKLLSDQIKSLKLESHYEVLQQEIRGKNGTEFIFSGLADQTIMSIKSMEGCTRVWCEEAQNISKRSWDILIPTIRAEGSEIWITFNPSLESDETYQRFIVNPQENVRSVEINWRDNPFFNDVLDRERRHCLAYDPDNYDNIWEGKCKPAVEGAIYFKEIQRLEEEGRIRDVPYDPLLKVHVVFDLGWADSMSIGMIQKGPSDIRIIDYIEDSHKTYDQYSRMLKEREYNWGRVWLPHDGFSKDPKTGLGTDQILRQLGWDVPDKDAIVKLSVEEGIKAVRQMFSRMYLDKTKCKDLVESLKRYRRHINKQTETAGAPEHDDFSHGADMLRYACVNLSMMHNDTLGTWTPSRPVRARRA